MSKEIECKYKFQDKEKYDGEDFCTLFIEKCKFLCEAGICDDNCQVYEDYKQLKRTQNALQDIKILVSTDYIKTKKQLVQNYDCLDNFMQKIEDKCGKML